MSDKTIALEWNRPQSVFMQASADVYRYVDLEGAIRSGKTKALVWKIIEYCINYPGIHCMLSRWTDETLKAQLKPRFYDECPPELLGRWAAEEQYQEFKNKSRVYLRALKGSDEAMRFGKFAGLTLGVVGVDQPEEVPKDVYMALCGRLSQPGMPQQMLLTPNPPAHDHWLADKDIGFPENNAKKGFLYLTTEMRDNERWLGTRYIEAQEAMYPAGSALHRRFILGKRGLSTEGEPVYGVYFKRQFHVAEVEVVPQCALLESWDFGHKHPAVLWSQLTPWGEWRILGEYMGKDQYIEDFVPQVIARRTNLFPEVSDVSTCCDPAGADNNSHGLRYSAVDILAQFGIYPRFIKGSNALPKRDWAIQQIVRYMLRMTAKGPALQVHPRCGTLIDGFEAGYVYDDKQTQTTTTPNIRRPKKDGYYDHLQNTAEYTFLNFVSGLPVAVGSASELRKNLRQAQRDVDPYDRQRLEISGRLGGGGRAGY